MDIPEHQRRRTRLAVVLRVGAHRSDVCFGVETASVDYGRAFSSRAQSLTPGHLVAVADGSDARSSIIWRWYDAVVLEQSDEHVRLWEPSHGEVLAKARQAQRRYPPGTRAYASAGLPGADWWVEGPAGAVDEADVDLDEVLAFSTEHDLWSSLT